MFYNKDPHQKRENINHNIKDIIMIEFHLFGVGVNGKNDGDHADDIYDIDG